MEMYLESLRAQSVRIEALEAEFTFRAGELLHTENSYKYRVAEVRKSLLRAGFNSIQNWRDAKKCFAMHLAQIR
jgi:uncharacterized SAM-dependent methyltransferase